jgi:hypothetical protein
MKEKILEILKSKLHGMAGHNWLIGIDEVDCDKAATEITAYIEQHYYPKECFQWYVNMSKDVAEDVYIKWLKNIKK